MDEIAKLHDLPESEWAELDGEMPPEFNATLYRWEQNYFSENCLGRIFGLNEGRLRELASLPALENIARATGRVAEGVGAPRFSVAKHHCPKRTCLSYRFQGMRPGLAEYDLASLLFDPMSGSRRMSGRNFTLIIWSAAACHRLPKCGKRFGYAQCNA